MENREGSIVPASKQNNICWSANLCKHLMEIAARAKPTRKGFHAHLEEMWNQARPMQPSWGSALARKLHRIYSKQSPDPERDDNSDPGDSEAEREVVSQPTTLPEELAATYAEARSPGPASLAGRERLMSKWVRMDPETLDEVDTAMVHFWAEEGDGTLWSLNCLIYAGAGVMMKRGKGVCKDPPPRWGPDRKRP